jgi:xylulokinase
LIKTSTIARDKFPDIVRSIDVLGPLLPRVADDLGLTREVQVVAGAFDVPAAAIGSGALDDYAAHIYLGTSSWIATHLPFKKTDLSSAMASVPCAIPTRYLLIAAQETAGGTLTWLRDKILYHHDALLSIDPPTDYFAALNQVAEQTPAGSHGLIFTPWLYGERAPVDDGWIRAGIHNLSLGNTRSDIVRAVMEGVAFNTRWILGPVEKFCGRTLNPINMIGGGANSRLWCQIHADVLNRSIRQIKDPILANARGAALIASVGMGCISFDDVPRHIQYQNEYQPNPDHRELYDKLFAEFVNLYKQSRRIYERLNRSKQ